MAFLKPIIRATNRDLSKIYPLTLLVKVLPFTTQNVILSNCKSIDITLAYNQTRYIHYSNLTLNKEVI